MSVIYFFLWGLFIQEVDVSHFVLKMEKGMFQILHLVLMMSAVIILSVIAMTIYFVYKQWNSLFLRWNNDLQ